MKQGTTITTTACLDCHEPFLRTAGGRLSLYCENCQNAHSACLDERLLHNYATGVVSAEDEVRVERHVEGCRDCADLLGRVVLAATKRAAP